MSGDEPQDQMPTDCGVCGYHLNKTKECRRHAPSPSHDEDALITVWNFTKDRQRCGAGTTIRKPVACDDCVHWHIPEGVNWPPNNYLQGRPAEYWEQAKYCVASAPGATTHEGLWTFWKVTSMFPWKESVGGCGDGVSVTALLEAAAKQAGRDAQRKKVKEEV